MMDWVLNPSVVDLRAVGVYDSGDWTQAWIGRASVDGVQWDDSAIDEMRDLIGRLLDRLGPALCLRVVVPGLDNVPVGFPNDSGDVFCADWVQDESELWLPRSAASDVGYFQICFGLEFQAIRDDLGTASWISAGSDLAQACANEVQSGRVFRLGSTSLRVSGAMDGTGGEFLCFAASESAGSAFESCISR